MKETDLEFTATLRSYLGQFSQSRKPIVPLIRNPDGTIDREKTLALPCYQNFNTETAAAILPKEKCSR